MSTTTAFRPKTYSDAINFLRARRDKDRNYRVITRAKHEIRDQIIALTHDVSEIEAGTCQVVFRLYDTNIVTFLPDGETAIAEGWDSNTTRDRMQDMAMPYLRELSTNDLGTKVELVSERTRMVGSRPSYHRRFPLGTPGHKVVLYRTTSQYGFTEWVPAEDKMWNSFADDVLVPDIEYKRRYTTSKKALLYVLREQVNMMEALHGEVRVTFDDRIRARGHEDELDTLMLDDGFKRKDWRPWVASLMEAGAGQVEVSALYERVLYRTFWDAYTPGKHAHHRTVHAADLLGVLNDIQL